MFDWISANESHLIHKKIKLNIFYWWRGIANATSNQLQFSMYVECDIHSCIWNDKWNRKLLLELTHASCDKIYLDWISFCY